MNSDLWDRLAASLGRAIEEERAIAPILVTALLAEAPGVRARMVRWDERYHSVAVVERLLEMSFERGTWGESAALLALPIVGRLNALGHPLREISQARARAWTAMGNACRLNGDLVEAEKRLDRAALLLACAPSPLEEAWFYRLRALLFRDQGDGQAAMAAQENAIALLVGHGPPAVAAVAMIELAALQLRGEGTDRALDSMRAAAEVLGSDLAAEVGLRVGGSRAA